MSSTYRANNLDSLSGFKLRLRLRLHCRVKSKLIAGFNLTPRARTETLKYFVYF